MTTPVFAIKHKPSGQWLHIRRFDPEGKVMLTHDFREIWCEPEEQAIAQASFLEPEGSSSPAILTKLAGIGRVTRSSFRRGQTQHLRWNLLPAIYRLSVTKHASTLTPLISSPVSRQRRFWNSCRTITAFRFFAWTKQTRQGFFPYSASGRRPIFRLGHGR